MKTEPVFEKQTHNVKAFLEHRKNTLAQLDQELTTQVESLLHGLSVKAKGLLDIMFPSITKFVLKLGDGDIRVGFNDGSLPIGLPDIVSQLEEIKKAWAGNVNVEINSERRDSVKVVFSLFETGKTEQPTRFESITSLTEALAFIQRVEFDPEYADWAYRIPDFLRQYQGHWRLLKIKDAQNQEVGFCVMSEDRGKLAKWNDKFMRLGWIDQPIELATSEQFAYYFIRPVCRGRGLGSKFLKALLVGEKEQGKKNIYGFSRYQDVIPLYQRTGAKLLNQTRRGDEVRTYYFWNLEEV